VLAGSKVLDAAYDEAKNAKGAAKTGRAANIRRRMKRSAGDHNHEGPHAENPEPGDTPEVIRDRAYTWQAGEALRLAHENKLAPIDPKEVIRAAKAEITETHVKAACEVARAIFSALGLCNAFRCGTNPASDARPCINVGVTGFRIVSFSSMAMESYPRSCARSRQRGHTTSLASLSAGATSPHHRGAPKRIHGLASSG
jgi:hypothetical protein